MEGARSDCEDIKLEGGGSEDIHARRATAAAQGQYMCFKRKTCRQKLQQSVAVAPSVRSRRAAVVPSVRPVDSPVRTRAVSFPVSAVSDSQLQSFAQPLPVLIRKAFFLVPSLGWSLPLYLRWILSPPGLRRPLRFPWFRSIKRFLWSRSRPFPWCAPRRRPRWYSPHRVHF